MILIPVLSRQSLPAWLFSACALQRMDRFRPFLDFRTLNRKYRFLLGIFVSYDSFLSFVLGWSSFNVSRCQSKRLAFDTCTHKSAYVYPFLICRERVKTAAFYLARRAKNGCLSFFGGVILIISIWSGYCIVFSF